MTTTTFERRCAACAIPVVLGLSGGLLACSSSEESGGEPDAAAEASPGAGGSDSATTTGGSTGTSGGTGPAVADAGNDSSAVDADAGQDAEIPWGPPPEGVAASAKTAPGCDGLRQFVDSTGSTCYLIYHKAKDYEHAAQQCRNYCGHLASLTTQAEHDSVVASVDDKHFWIGLKDPDGVGAQEFKWESGEQFGFTAWDPGDQTHAAEPDHNGNCVVVRENRLWADESCGTKFTPLCEVPFGSSISSAPDVTLEPSFIPSCGAGTGGSTSGAAGAGQGP